MLKGSRQVAPGEQDVMFVGIPYDGGALYKPGAAEAPDRIREISHNMPFVTECGELLSELNVLDGGNASMPVVPPEEAFNYLRGLAAGWFAESFLLVAGGDHSISGPILNGLGDASSGSVGIIYFDAHTDLSYEYGGTLYSHASPLRRGLENKNLNPENIVLVGVRSFEEEPLKYIRQKSISYFDPSTIEYRGVEEVTHKIVEHFRNIENVYISIDIDVLDPAFAPGTGIPEAGGLSTRQLLTIIRGLWPLNLVGADVVEVSPPLDINDITSITAHKIIKEILGLLLKRKRLNLRTRTAFL